MSCHDLLQQRGMPLMVAVGHEHPLAWAGSAPCPSTGHLAMPSKAKQQPPGRAFRSQDGEREGKGVWGNRRWDGGSYLSDPCSCLTFVFWKFITVACNSWFLIVQSVLINKSAVENRGTKHSGIVYTHQIRIKWLALLPFWPMVTKVLNWKLYCNTSLPKRNSWLEQGNKSR